MKKLNKTLISVLLFSFVFLVMHDFAMAQLDTCHVHETSEKTSKVSHQIHDIHENMHKPFVVDADTSARFTDIVVAFSLNYTTSLKSSDNTFVLERPPLS